MILGGGNEVGGWGVWILLGERNRGEEGVTWDGWILDEYGLEKEWGRGRNGGFGERG